MDDLEWVKEREKYQVTIRLQAEELAALKKRQAVANGLLRMVLNQAASYQLNGRALIKSYLARKETKSE